LKYDISDYGISRKEAEEIIDNWIFSERNRKILKRRLLDGLTYEALAEESELSVRQVKAIVYRGTDIISDKI